MASEYWGKIYTVVDAIRLNRSDGRPRAGDGPDSSPEVRRESRPPSARHWTSSGAPAGPLNAPGRVVRRKGTVKPLNRLGRASPAGGVRAGHGLFEGSRRRQARARRERRPLRRREQAGRGGHRIPERRQSRRRYGDARFKLGDTYEKLSNGHAERGENAEATNQFRNAYQEVR